MCACDASSCHTADAGVGGAAWSSSSAFLDIDADGLLALFSELPIDVLQALFTLSDPSMVSNKFRAFAAMDSHSQRAEDFVALEDWLNDGVALTAGVARDCLTGWYGENRPARGQWTVAGTVIEPGKLADLIVLSEDPFEIPVDALKDLQVETRYRLGTR